MTLTRDVLIAQKQLRAGEELRVMLSPYRGQTYLHCRRWFLEEGRWMPGKGLSVRLCELPFLLHALRVTEQSALEEGLLFARDYADCKVPVPPEARSAA